VYRCIMRQHAMAEYRDEDLIEGAVQLPNLSLRNALENNSNMIEPRRWNLRAES
jgi:hypothetical protein